VNYNKQLPFDFEHRPSLSGDDFLISPSNQEAVAWLDKWPDWPSPLLILYGPPGCGKTHLSHVFMASSGAVQLTPELIKDFGVASLLNSQQNFVIDDGKINTFVHLSEVSLFHLYNDLALRGGHMLITAESHPVNWAFKLADLSSRFKAAQAIGIGMPDDNLIKAVLVKLFSDRQVRVEISVIDYITKRMERSLDAARNFVHLANELALVEKKGITLALARQVLGDL
jgi:chromosomal replication initiation ATPase DnaA